MLKEKGQKLLQIFSVSGLLSKHISFSFVING